MKGGAATFRQHFYIELIYPCLRREAKTVWLKVCLSVCLPQSLSSYLSFSLSLFIHLFLFLTPHPSLPYHSSLSVFRFLPRSPSLSLFPFSSPTFSFSPPPPLVPRLSLSPTLSFSLDSSSWLLFIVSLVAKTLAECGRVRLSGGNGERGGKRAAFQARRMSARHTQAKAYIY